MGFIIRSAFWLSLVLLIIPIGGADGDDGARQVSVLEAFWAARTAAGDIAGMCERQPQVCDTGRAAMGTIASRAETAAVIAMGWIDGRDEPETAVANAGAAAPATVEEAIRASATADKLTTGTVKSTQ
ncbi:MAG: DUF5330 domain-containing protein [Rhizobiaceae bacterium]|nr:DUF5330 domain-containing protein [Rhizobiaceae bacterium]MCV0405516.1 DUF5330 domain-containing protein [Rhizobiaceae bacterium]